MEDEMVVLKERLSGMKTLGFVENGNVELKKEIDELKTRNKELVERNEALNKATKHKKTAVSAKKTLELESERMKLKDAMKHMGIVRDENFELKKEIDVLKRKVEQNEVVVEKNEALDGTFKEIEDLQKQIIELEKQLDGKGKLELENERLKREFDENSDQLKKVIEELRRKLQEKTAAASEAQQMHQNSTVLNEQSVNEELREARRELINVMHIFFTIRGMSSSLTIGVKTMGELDLKPFLNASNKLNKSSEEALSGSIQLCCSWRENIKDSTWHPFKIIKNGEGIQQEVLDEEDAKLKRLKDESGEEVYKAYNPSSDTNEPVQELWNYKEGKRATLSEGISFMSRLLKMYMRRV
ncbi:hypothetical protein MKW92_039197 [Papaver armeniacum]|nr:hypothetical protein MKW92_039197 [Papaver armeniacum]